MNLNKPIFYTTIVFLITNFIIGYMVSFLLVPQYYHTFALNGALIAYIIIFARAKIYEKVKLTYTDITIMLMFILSILSLVFSANRYNSIYGTYSRYEGIYSLSLYYIIFIAMTLITAKYKKRIFKTFMIVATIVSIIGILQALGVFINFNLLMRWGKRAVAPFGNPNFYCSFATIYAGAAIGIFVYSKSKLLGIVLEGLAFYSAASTHCSSVIAGIVMQFIFILGIIVIIMIRDKKFVKFRKKIILLFISIALFIGMMFLANVSQNNAITREMKTNESYISSGVTSDRMFSNRLGIWKRAFSVFPKYWAFGSGIDNFELVCNDESLPPIRNRFDKAHNEYIQIMATQGIFAIIVYLIHLFVVFAMGVYSFLRRDNRGAVFDQILTIIFFGYLAQAFFNISVIQVAPIFWMFSGMIVKRQENLISCLFGF